MVSSNPLGQEILLAIWVWNLYGKWRHQLGDQAHLHPFCRRLPRQRTHPPTPGLNHLLSGVHPRPPGDDAPVTFRASPVKEVAAPALEDASRNFRVASGTFQVTSRTFQDASGTLQDASRTFQDASGTFQDASRTFQVASGTFQDASGTFQDASRTVGFCPIFQENCHFTPKTPFPSPNRRLYPFRSRSTVKINKN